MIQITRQKCVRALILAEPISALISECFRQRRFPVLWKIADVVPVLKSSKSLTFENTRPISLLPVPAKFAERLVLDNLRSRLTTCLGENQYGIRKSSSTTHAIIAVHDFLTALADDPDIGASVFIGFDFSKAFDRICHRHLLNVLWQQGFPIGFLLLVKNYLYGRQQRVRLNNSKSDLKPVTSGVPQGSLLGPYLFGVYVSSLQPLYRSTLLVKYVDDSSIAVGIRKSDFFEDIQRLNAEVKHVSEWSALFNLTLNAAKTTGFIYYRGNFKDICNLESFICCVDFQSDVRFLGVILSDTLGWKSHVDFIEKKCAQRIYILQRIRSHTTVEQFNIIYNLLVRSLIEYASPAFVGLSKGDSNRLQSIQNRCLKIKGLTGATDLAVRRKDAAIKLFEQILTCDTAIKQLFPSRLPSGRISVPFSRTSVRRKSFFPAVSILKSSAFCD